MKPAVVILSAPSGGGKTTIARALAERRRDVGLSVSATTRKPRPSERDGEAYHFVPRAEFRRRVDAGELLEWAEYAGELYGTLRSEVDALRNAGRHPLLDIEVQGARQVRAALGAKDVIGVFLLPPSPTAWGERLLGRKTESADALKKRLATAQHELDAVSEYDHVVVNGELEQAVVEVSAIIDTGGRPARRPADLHERIAALRRAAARGSLEGGA